ncbi:MAG: alpha/beta hydrolase-fold protein [Bacteroidota bacterium]
MKYLSFIVLFIGISVSTIAQTQLTGVIVDKDKQTALPYVNIGIRHKNIGTVSLLNGNFSIQIPQQNNNDTLTFFMIGYEELKLPIANISTNQKVQLIQKKYELYEIPVSANRLVEKSFGIKKNNSPLHFTDGSVNQNDIFEIAQVIHLGETLSKITSLNLYVNESKSDSGTFRINFYDVKDSKPGQRIIEKNIIHKQVINTGWLKFDLTAYNIYLKGKLIVALEFIPSGNSKPIYYEIKIGGSAQSFVRSSSHGEWQVPPHHYRMFITALTDDTKQHSKQNDLEEKETTPTTTFFSRPVNDSFSVFINFPKNYSKNKQQKFPVIYLLDANVYFDIIARNMNATKLNQSILVGIGYKNFALMDSLRNRDYTFPKALPKDSFTTSGGADRFLSFIETELVPYIDKAYRTEPEDRTLMGHSLGGYFTLYAFQQALRNNRICFKDYVSASPSLHYCDKYLMTQFEDMTDIKNEKQQNLYVSFGGREDGEDGETGTDGIDNFNFLIKLLNKQFKNIHLVHELYPTYGHMETAVPSFMNGPQKIK